MKSDFVKLEALRLLAKKFLDVQKTSLAYFSSGLGFGHIKGGTGDVSVSSTATCVLSLTATGLWERNKADTKALLKELIFRRTSSKLEEDNPFTTAWILEAVTALEPRLETATSLEPEALKLDTADLEELHRKETALNDHIRAGGGGVRISPYPGSGYLTQLVLRVLLKRKALAEDLREPMKNWAWAQLTRQLALIQSESKSKDAFAVAYLLIVVTMLTPKSAISPEESSIQKAALDTFFRCQLIDGTWPLSRPLFHYPKIGSAHCYEYELLTQLLGESDLSDLLLNYLPNLELSVRAIEDTGYALDGQVLAWSSGHHPQEPNPESWATASVYHFFYKLDRLLAKAVRLELFRYMELPLPAPNAAMKEQSKFASKVLDSTIHFHGKDEKLKEILWEKFVQPISAAAPDISNGIRFDDSTPRAAIFFGPPGTSKTELSREVANFLGWPFLAIDPSMLLKKGMNEIQAEANAVFRILEQTEGVVVLLDEFDELVQDRELDRSEQPSRLLTTAMLPKLASIHKKGTLVLILATNNIDRFDLAIRRQGRFDRVFQIMPPTLEEKLGKETWGAKKSVNVAKLFTKMSYEPDADSRTILDDLTFGEFNSFADDLAIVAANPNPDALKADSVVRAAARNSTMTAAARKGDSGNETWKARSEKEKEHIR